jgi:hypothetical protein
MVTLTYPGDWRTCAPTPDTVVAHRQAFDRRFERATAHKPAYLRKREWQARGAPHLHLAGAWPTHIGTERLEEWVSRTWYDIVDSGDERHLAAGTGIDWAAGYCASDPNRMAAYFASYGTTTGRYGRERSKEYQNRAPDGWVNDNGSIGRHWGYVGVTRATAEVRISRAQLVDVQRFLRRYLASQKRTHRTKGLGGQRSRPVNRRYRLPSLTGTDAGFGFLTNDGPALAIAIARATNPPTQEDTPWPKGQPRMLP